MILLLSLFLALAFFNAFLPNLPNDFSSQNFIGKYLQSIRPKWNVINEPKNALIDISLYVKSNLQKDAVFLVPAGFSSFRIYAERAIVTSFKLHPFSDIGLREWYSRIQDCYGPTTQKGFAAYPEMDNNYNPLMMKNYGI